MVFLKPDKLIYRYLTFSIFDKIFFHLRMNVAPFSEILEYIPKTGNILDAGCGYGFLAHLIANNNPKCCITGIDKNADRISQARSSVIQGENIYFIKGDLTRNIFGTETYSAIICFDLLHHIPTLSQPGLIKLLVKHLAPKGILIIKDIDTNPKWKYILNYLQDIITSLGGKISCRDKNEWRDIMLKNGLEIKHLSYPKRGWIYPHVLLIAQKQ
jgi:2-polyprenyl-3-methyl-5-hydroxy-6-metoxy-1,4-benzoquinol methylase